MRVAVLGTGTVGTTLAGALLEQGHEVVLGSRSSNSAGARAWLAAHPDGSAAAYPVAAADSELVVVAVAGLAAPGVLMSVPAEQIDGLVVLDVTNPLDFSSGFPPAVVHRDGLSTGEQLQAIRPRSRVVKAFCTMNAAVMVDPGRLGRPTALLMAGNDDEAKAQVAELARPWGWPAEQVVDLGDISAARAMELNMHLWLRIMGALGTPAFNIDVVQ